MTFRNKYEDNIVMETYDVMSPFDKRDFKAPEPRLEAPKAYSFKKALPILNQKATDYCTSFAGLAMCFINANAGLKFKKLYENAFALKLGVEQMLNSVSFWAQMFLRREVWETQGRHPRAALKQLYRGIEYKELKLKINGYYRVPLQTNYDKWIYNYGGLYIGVFFNHEDIVDGVFKDQGNYPKKYGHQMFIDTYNENGYTGVNSWGEQWGDKGRFLIERGSSNLIKECWVVPAQEIDFYKV